MKERLDLLWDEFHLPIWATEFDWNWRNSVDFGDHSYHAEVIDNFYRLMYSHQVQKESIFYSSAYFNFLHFFQSIHGILSWTMNTLDENNIPNKAGEAYINLYNQQWRSSQLITPTTDSTSVAFRGFHGDYEVVIKRNSDILGQFNFNLDQDLNFDCIEDLILGSIQCFNA